MSTEGLVPVYAASVHDGQLMKYYGVVVCLMYMCDYVETFADEVEYMWKAERWNIARILFFFCRYIPISQIPVLFSLYTPGLTKTGCHAMHTTVLVVTWVGEAFPMAILVLCLYALFGSNRGIAIYFAAPYAVVTAALLTTLVVYLTTLSVPSTPAQLARGACFFENTPVADRVMLANRGLRLAVYFIMAALAFYKGWDRSRRLRSPLMKAMNQGGLVYYSGIFAMAACDVAVRYLDEPAKLKLVTYMGRFGAPILANRLLLEMRKQLFAGGGTHGYFDMSGSAMRFGSQPTTAVATDRTRASSKISGISGKMSSGGCGSSEEGGVIATR